MRPNNNWCEICQERCSQHPTICSICGANLTVPPPISTAIDATTNDIATNARLLDEMREASLDLTNILGNLRGQVQDLDNLTRNILQQPDDENSPVMPQDIWDPQNSSANPSTRPTSNLSKIPRFVLDEKSTIFRQAKLTITDNLTLCDAISTAAAAASVTSTTIPAVNEYNETDYSSQISKENNLSLDCIVGEFGPVKEFNFEMEAFILASPFTGKGGDLSSETKSQVSHNKNEAAKTKKATEISSSAPCVFMGRGDGITFVQKALMAQAAGASAVIIANNTSSPWPYVMKDSKGEAEKIGQQVSIPVVMIKEVDAQQILRKFEEQNQRSLNFYRTRKIPDGIVPKQIIITKGNPIQIHPASLQNNKQGQHQQQIQKYHLCCNLQISTQSSDCAVCCERLKNSETVLQVPGCGHIFHEECALVWLRSHNTCPYCRWELPTDDPEYERERRLRQRRTTSTRREQTSSDTNAFYG